MLNKIFSCKWFTSKLFILLPSSFSITKVRLSHISQILVAVFLQTVKIPQGCCKLVRVAQQKGRIWGCFEDIAAFSDMNFTLLEIQLQSFWSESNPGLVFLFFPHLQGATPAPLLVLLKLPTQRHPITFQKYPRLCLAFVSLQSSFSGRISPEPWGHSHLRLQKCRASCRRLEITQQHQAAVEAPSKPTTVKTCQSSLPPNTKQLSYSTLFL